MIAIVAREIHESIKSRWFLAVTAVFCALAVGISYLSFSGASVLGFASFSRTVAGLLNLMLLFVPLMGLLVGALNLSGEREDGTLGYVLAQPIGRGSVYFAKFAGQGVSLACSIAFGLGLAGFVVGRQVGTAGAFAYAVLAVDSMLLGAASLGIGILVAVLSSTRLRALVTALLLWIVFGFALDLASIGLVVSGELGARGLFWLTLANPVQAAKVLCLLALSAKLEVLGPAGIYAVKTFGGSGAAAILGGSLIAWATLPVGLGWFVFRRMNIR